VRLRHACSLRRHARHNFGSEGLSSEREENCFDFRLMRRFVANDPEAISGLFTFRGSCCDQKP
jgi:hypothetical protein